MSKALKKLIQFTKSEIDLLDYNKRKEYTRPLVSYLFVTIDTMSYLWNKNLQNRYQKWCENFGDFTVFEPQKITPIDLYHARNGMIHSSTALSYKRGNEEVNNRVIFRYYWGKPTSLDAANRLVKERGNKEVLVSVDHLKSFVFTSMDAFYEHTNYLSSGLDDVIKEEILTPSSS